MKINIAIDGPSGAGKSTIADILANKLSYTHLDTGAMYRAIAYKIIKEKIAFNDEKAIASILKNDFKLEMDKDKVILNGQNITDKIRTNEISLAASDISKLDIVRNALVAMQKKIAANKGYILDGRDICDVVLPDAEVKIFLTASPEDRAKRRYDQNKQKGISGDYQQILSDIKKRDYQDSHRLISPLKISKDAIVIDSSYKSIDEVVDAILKIIALKDKEAFR